jgi:drug/metabolite transporter (DMT)-like permease
VTVSDPISDGGSGGGRHAPPSLPLNRLLSHRLAPEAILLFATALWGLAFLVVHLGVATVPPLPFVALRFATAAVMVRLLTGARLDRVTPMELRAGPLIGLAMVCGYALQATGLQTIGAGRAAFIGALYVPIVPLLQWAFLHKRPQIHVWVSTALATAGLLALAAPVATLPGAAQNHFGRGDAFALTAAFAVASEILLMAQFAPRVDPRRLAIVECLCVTFYAIVLALLTGQRLPPIAPFWLACALGLGAASAFLQVSSNWAMRRVPAHRAMLIFATEPVWGGVFGALHGEPMGVTTLFGAGLILSALLLNAMRRTGVD